MRHAKGFTLIEVMVTIAVVAILASIAVPAYSDYIMRSKISEAVGNLSDMRVKMEQYFLDNRMYTNACDAGTLATPPAGRYFGYVCSDLSATTYRVTATGVAAQGMGGFQYRIDQNNLRETLGVAPGWSMTANCWTLKKDGSC